MNYLLSLCEALNDWAQTKLGSISLKQKACVDNNLPPRSRAEGASSALNSYSTQTNGIIENTVFRGVPQINMAAYNLKMYYSEYSEG